MADSSTDDDSKALSILYQVLLALGTVLIFIIAYELVRKTEFGKRIYAPRLFLLPENTPEISTGWLGWLKNNKKYDEDYILKNNGLDAVMCLKIYRMGYEMFFFIFIVVAVVTIPINLVHRDMEKSSYNTSDSGKKEVVNNKRFFMEEISPVQRELTQNLIEASSIFNTTTGVDLDRTFTALQENLLQKYQLTLEEVSQELATQKKRSVELNDLEGEPVAEEEIVRLTEKQLQSLILMNVKYLKNENETAIENGDKTSTPKAISDIEDVTEKAKSTLEKFDIRVFFFDTMKKGEEGYAYAHVVIVYFVVIFVCYKLFRTYQDYLSVMEKYIREGGVIQENNILGEVLQHSTIMVRNIPSELQDDEKLTQWFTKLGIGKIENVIIARSRSTIGKEIEKRNVILNNLEIAYGTWINNIKNKKSGEGFLSKYIRMLVKNDESNIIGKVDPEENDLYRPKHFLKAYGIIPIKYVDTIYYYENELLSITENIKSLRYEAANSKKWSQTAFVTFSNHQSAKIAAQLILYSSQNPNVEC